MSGACRQFSGLSGRVPATSFPRVLGTVSNRGESGPRGEEFHSHGDGRSLCSCADGTVGLERLRARLRDEASVAVSELGQPSRRVRVSVPDRSAARRRRPGATSSRGITSYWHSKTSSPVAKSTSRVSVVSAVPSPPTPGGTTRRSCLSSDHGDVAGDRRRHCPSCRPSHDPSVPSPTITETDGEMYFDYSHMSDVLRQRKRSSTTHLH